MASSPGEHWLEIDPKGPVTVVRFVCRQMFDDEVIDWVGKQLRSLVEDRGCTNLVLHFGPVRSMSSHMLGELIVVQKKAKAAGGRVAFCGFTADLYDVFVVLGLHRVFPIYETEEEALESF